MSQSPNLPATRPTADLYGPDLVNDRPVKLPTRELDADKWNLAKADLAYVAQVSALAKLYVPSGATSIGAAGIVAWGTAPTSLVHNGAGDVTITYPTTVRIYGARATSNTDGVSVVSALFTPGGNTVRVKSGGADCNFTLAID